MELSGRDAATVDRPISGYVCGERVATIEENYKFWNDRYDWSAHGDEWSEMAAHCGQTYEYWKQSLIEQLIEPHVKPDASVLEIGCGHGRWTRILASRSDSVWAADLGENNLAWCRENVSDRVRYLLTGGDLSPICSHSIDFIWSFDVFVHIEPADTRTYLKEFKRVMKPGGLAIIHHPDEPNERGWRSQLNGKVMRRLAAEEGLVVAAQIDSWGKRYECNVRLAGDLISFIRVC